MDNCFIATLDYLYQHNKTILVFGGLIVTAAVRVMPPPGTPFSLYTFIYDWAHQFFNLTNTRLTNAPVITPPANKEPA